MKSIVIYYSQTGNTKRIAQALQQGIIRQTGQCDIVRIKEIKPEDLLNYDLIGIGSPVWSSCPTTNVIHFIKSLPDALQGRHFFFYCTHGVVPGRCLIRGVQPLQERGMTVIGWKDWYCAASLPGHGKPWLTDGHPDEIDIVEAESFGAAMVSHSRRISAGETDLIPALPSPEASDQIYGIGHPFMVPPGTPDTKGKGQPDAAPPANEDQPYPLEFPTSMEYVLKLEGMQPHSARPGLEMRINADKCNGCGQCARACCFDNIDASVQPPVFKTQNCEHCNFCEGVCPTGALEIDFPLPDANHRERDIWMSKPLELAEAKGLFRRLIKEEDIGWDTPWELVTDHPRHKFIP